MKINRLSQRNTTPPPTQGTSLAELLVYIAILSILSLALIFSVNSLFGALAQLKARQEITQSSILALERISREVRRAHSVNMFEGTFGTSPGLLVLDTTTLSNNPITLRFGITGGRITLQENIGAVAPLTHGTVAISNLVFTHMTNPNSEGIYVELTATRNVQGTTVSKDFSTFVVLDGS